MAVKQRSTYYTPRKVEAMRRNANVYEWAKREKERAAALGDVYVRLGWEWLWNVPTPQSVPRSYAVNQQAGCPVCGESHHAYGRWPWLADPLANPWKLVCPNCRSVFPSNDFAAYYESGKDENGLFRRELADDRYLRNELYPDRGEKWGVDDSLGWIADDGTRYTFVAFYNHWKVWIGMIDPLGNRFPKSDAPWGHGGIVDNALAQLRDAYLYTGEPKYARAGIVLLDRVADLYPDMDAAVYLWEDGFLHSHGLTGQGKIVGSIWETAIVKTFISAYDAFYPEMTAEDPELAAFLQDKAARGCSPGRKSSMAQIRTHMEDGILRPVYGAVRKAQIKGNNGMHQSALALAAVVLDEPGTTEEWLDFVFQDGGVERTEQGGWKVTGGNVRRSLLRDVDRDGFGDEAAPDYNYLWVEAFRQLADTLHGYDRYPQGDFYRNPKFLQMLRANSRLYMLDRFVPSIGDSASAGNPGLIGRLETFVEAFEKTGEPLFAQMAYTLNGCTFEGLRGGIYSPDPDGLRTAIENAVAEHGPLPHRSVNLGEYGFSALKDGSGDARRGLWMYYGRNFGHGHKDTLTIGLFAFGLDLLPDMGYPEKCDNSHQKTHHWDRNTVCHNTVVVDSGKQRNSIVGTTRLFVGEGLVQLIEAEAKQVYPQTDVYRRCTALVRVDEANCYAIDVFRVRGGAEHHYMFHGPEGNVSVEGLRLVDQPTGTYAGPDIAYAEPYDADPSESLPAYCGSGFHYLTDVERDSAPPGRFAVEWAVHDTWGVLERPDDNIRLRLTMLGQADEAALADGRPSQNRPGNPQRLRQLIVKRRAEGGASRFVAVIEPYRSERLIRSVSEVEVEGKGSADAVVLKIERSDGRTDYYIHSTDAEARLRFVTGSGSRIVFQGMAGLYAESGGTSVYAFVAGGSCIGPEEAPCIHEAVGFLAGTVTGFTREPSVSNKIRIRMRPHPGAADLLAGKHIHVGGSGRNPVYRIERCVSGGPDKYELDIGHTTLIEDMEEPVRTGSGTSGEAVSYRYAIAAGDPFTIPLYTEWHD